MCESLILSNLDRSDIFLRKPIHVNTNKLTRLECIAQMTEPLEKPVFIYSSKWQFCEVNEDIIIVLSCKPRDKHGKVDSAEIIHLQSGMRNLQGEARRRGRYVAITIAALPLSVALLFWPLIRCL